MADDDREERFRRFLAFEDWERRHGPARSQRPQRTISELYDEYLASLDKASPLGLSRPGIRKYLTLPFAWQGEQVTMGGLRPGDITLPLYSAWVRAIYETRTIRKRAPSPGRVENVRVGLQACFTFHQSTGEVGPVNPLKGFPKQKGYNRRRQARFTAEELDRFCAALPALDAAILRVEFLTLQREATIRCLRKDQVDWTERDLLLTVKGGKPARVVCPDEALEIIRVWAATFPAGEYVFPSPRNPWRPMPYQTFRSHLVAAEKATGLRLNGEPPRSHAARHGGARHLMPTTSLPLISAQLTHADLKTTSIYLGVDAKMREALRQAMNDANKKTK